MSEELKRPSEIEAEAVPGRHPSVAVSEPPLAMRRLSSGPLEVPTENPPLPRPSSEPVWHLVGDDGPSVPR